MSRRPSARLPDRPGDGGAGERFDDTAPGAGGNPGCAFPARIG
jgi:hypothetical protein